MTLWKNMLIDIEFEFNFHSKEKFLRHKMISRTISPNDVNVTQKYLNHVKNNEYCSTNILPKVLDSTIGSPTIIEGYSQGTVQHCHYLAIMFEHLKLNITDFDHITDIGGGYGNLYRMAKKLNYQGEFDIVDFPIMHKIQEYYIKKLKLKSPNFISMKDLNPASKSILFGFHSVNEMPMSDRKLLEKKYPMYDHIMILYNDIFDGYDNVKYFKNLKDKLNDIFDVKIIEDKLKTNARFLIASKKV